MMDYLPEGGLKLDTFPELNLPKRAGTKEYYRLLQDAQKNGQSPSLDNIMNQMDGDSQYDHVTWDEFEELSEAEKKTCSKTSGTSIERNCRTKLKRNVVIYQVSLQI